MKRREFVTLLGGALSVLLCVSAAAPRRSGLGPAAISPSRRPCVRPPDGYTLLIVGATNAVNATLYDKLNFNFIRDIAPVAGIIRVPLIMEVHPSVPAKTVPEFIAFAKANPGKINIRTAVCFFLPGTPVGLSALDSRPFWQKGLRARR